jgi:hypothetical protein
VPSNYQYTKSWQSDPDTAQAVKGGTERGSANAVFTHDPDAVVLMQQMVSLLTKIEYHLSVMTDADLEKGEL